LKKYKLFLLVVVFISQATTASNIIEENISIGSSTRILIDSKVLSENRNLLVHLPDSYTKSNKHYPVLYLLDGERHFNHSILATRLLQEQQRAPELIIVAIPNVDGARQRDLASEKEKFTQFLKDEVMSYIDKNYRTTGLNTLYGHSLAGYFTMNLLASNPDLFKNYIAASPPLQINGSEVYNKILRRIDINKPLDKSLYFTSASQAEEGERVTHAIKLIVKLLKDRKVEKLRWNYELLDYETHITGYYLSFFKGITHVFKSYKIAD
jgi:predicted alpha/beta superfamily hydrolase